MSEYQYYEFRAVDRQLSAQQMKELRNVSSRAEITASSFTNTYNFGSFKGEPKEFMESYFDAFVYVSNFGMCTLMLRFPVGVIAENTLGRYVSEDALESWSTGSHTIIEWKLNDEEGSGEWMDGEGWLGRLLPIREELIRGDYRSLYLGWLSTAYWYDSDNEDEGATTEGEDSEDDEGQDGVEPPVPAGLSSLTDAQASLAEFLGVGVDLVTAAASASIPLKAQQLDAPEITEWVAELPEEEVRAALMRVIQGEAMAVQTQLQSRYYRSTAEANASETQTTHRRHASEIIALEEKLRKERKLRESAEQRKKRRAELNALVPRFPQLWQTVYSLAEKKTGSAYDQACTLLVDMRDAYKQAGRAQEFDTELNRFLSQHTSKTITSRLKAAGFERTTGGLTLTE